ncbi:MAG: superoxide dismutase copper/zinc binding protein [Cyanobacteria bacterium RYN_339]|nr:superoxide dismutase copper/zinc binding protein [Cyanobacteria bacterium RYN_339]
MPHVARLTILALASLSLSACAALMHGELPETPPGADVLMRGHAAIAGPGLSGTAKLTEFRLGTLRAVRLTVRVKGDPAVLTPGQHGVHLHATGDCGAPGFTSAGGHFDPGPAGNPDPDANHPYHLGDLPNMEVDAQGNGVLDALTTRVTLTDGPLSLFDADGAAIIIHKNPDQGITGAPKSGVSGGPRLACGIILK